MNKGNWVLLSDERVGLITSWDVASGLAVAETPSGATVDRPISFAEHRWRVLPDDGLRVLRAIDPGAIKATVANTPNDLVVLALKDAGGAIETTQLRQDLTPDPIPGDEWERWWKRVQIRLDQDERIDCSRAREHRYRLRREGETASAVDLRPAKQDEQRLGRTLADAPQLRRARERGAKPGPHSADDRALLDLEIALAEDESVDPTDRFMAAELGVWVSRFEASQARVVLGSDVLAVDLLRVPGHESRSLAIEWAFSFVDEHRSDPEASGTVIAFQSAVAAGPPWSAAAIAGLTQRSLPVRGAMAGALGWAIPGSPEAGQHKYPEDLEVFVRRVERARALREGRDGPALAGLWEGAIKAVDALPSTPKHDADVRRLRTSIAEFAWSSWDAIDASSRPSFREVRPLSDDALTLIIRAGTREQLKALERPLLEWFAIDPRRYGPALRLYATTQGTNASAMGLQAALDLLQRSKVHVVAQTLLRWAVDDPGMDELTEQIASLAVTTAPDDPEAKKLLDQLAEQAAARLLEGRDAGSGPLTFSSTGWTRFAQLMRLQLEESAAKQATASQAAADARAESERLQRLSERRAESLTEARAATGERSSRDANQLASTLLKPVALALADSYQANSLEALRDRLLSVLQRGRITQFAKPGDVVDFDPVRHQWVGDGYPTDQVKAMSPGFAVSTEGEEDVVVVPARVVAP